jgi:two-component system sensor histidine kinase KdpD
MDNFFTETNLSALREMAMRHTAHEVEEKLSAGPQPAVVDILAPARSDLRPQADPEPRRKDRILICLTGNPFSAVLIRRGKRVADYLQADCLAIHVAAPGEDREGVERHLSFARNLRIETHTVYAAEIPRAIADFARQQLITQIFMGRSAPRPWYRLRDTVVQAVAAHSREMQVIIVASRRR